MFGRRPKDKGRSQGAAAAEPLMNGDGRPKANQKAGKGWQKVCLVFYTIMLLISSVGNTVYFKRMTNAMPNYGWYLTMLSTVIYVPLFGLLAGPGILETKQELISKFVVMGVCDGLSGTLMVLGGVHTGGTLQVLLGQAVIPFTMVASVTLIGKRYHLLQQVGAAVIVLGIVVANAGGGGSVGDGNELVFNVLFLMAIVPSALSSVFKEVAFRGYDGNLDVNVLQFWVASFQVVTNMLAMPIYTLKMLGAQQVPIEKMPGLTFGGTRCLFFLEDQVLTDCGMPGERPCDHCHYAWVPVMGYMAFNLFFNIFTMLVIKHGSATLSFLVSTLRMPLSSLAFSSPLIMGVEAVPVGFSDYFSLTVILAGLMCYRLGARCLKRAQRREEVPSPTTSPRWPSPTDSASALVRRGTTAIWRLAPLFSTGTPMMQPAFVLVRERAVLQPRSADRVRDDLYRRLGAASPLNSPKFRDRSPPGSPTSLCGSSGPRSPPMSPQVAGGGSAGDAEEEHDGADIAITGLPPQA
mmetsp:Transcript_94738/g.296275  ORF Transcript_94738/g.296275 Transcript_94738/m.296275 type:complete len:521 (+) Transcript_94738:59-1621(+)